LDIQPAILREDSCVETNYRIIARPATWDCRVGLSSDYMPIMSCSIKQNPRHKKHESGLIKSKTTSNHTRRK